VERTLFGRENAAGIRQRLVEKARVEVIAQVVVGRDVPQRARDCIGPHAVHQPIHGLRQSRQALLKSTGNGHVFAEEPQDADQVLGTPISEEVGLSGSDGAAHDERPVEPRVVDTNYRRRRGIPTGTELKRFFTLGKPKPTDANALQPPQDELTTPPIECFSQTRPRRWCRAFPAVFPVDDFSRAAARSGRG